eukprot:scaffold34698_cov173-Amphora_coffeaeformis.AAC.10
MALHAEKLSNKLSQGEFWYDIPNENGRSPSVKKYQFKGRRWKKISSQAKAFVHHLLVLDPEDRATAQEALMSSWLHRRHTATVRNPHHGELKYVKQCIERYVNYPRLRKLALMVIAYRSTSEEIGILRKVFQQYDTDHSGTLDYEQFKEALLDAGFTDNEGCHEIFNAVDVDGTGVIRYTEFLAATIEAAGWISEERLATAFDRMDHDDTGYISKENLRDLLGDAFPEGEIDFILKEAATSKDGITYADFLAQWDLDKKEIIMREWSQHMMPGSVEADMDGLRSRSNQAEDFLSGESIDSTDARSNFLERKAISVRKMEVLDSAIAI